MPLPSHFKSRDQTNDLTRPHTILFYQMFVPSRSLWLLKKSTARLLRINFLLLLLVVTRVHGRNSKNMALEEVNSNTEFDKILGNSSRWVNVLCFNLPIIFSLLIAKPMFVTKSREHKLCAVLIRKGIEIAASLGDTENARFNFGFSTRSTPFVQGKFRWHFTYKIKDKLCIETSSFELDNQKCQIECN